MFPALTSDQPLYLTVHREKGVGIKRLPWAGQLSCQKTIERKDSRCRQQLALAKQRQRLLKFGPTIPPANRQVNRGDIEKWRVSQRKLYNELFVALEKRNLVCVLTSEGIGKVPIFLFAGPRRPDSHPTLLGSFLDEHMTNNSASAPLSATPIQPEQKPPPQRTVRAPQQATGRNQLAAPATHTQQALPFPASNPTLAGMVGTNLDSANSSLAYPTTGQAMVAQGLPFPSSNPTVAELEGLLGL